MQLRAAISWQRMKGLSPLTKLQPKKGNWSSKMPKESTKWRPAISIGKTFPSNRHGTGSLWVLKKHGQQPRFRKACVGLLFSWRRGFFPCLENVFFSSLVVMHPPARTLGKRRFSSAEKPSLTKSIFWLRHVVGASSPKALWKENLGSSYATRSASLQS